MGNKPSSTGINLPEIRQEILEWKSRSSLMRRCDVEVPWTESNLTAVLDYVLKLEGTSISHFTSPRPDPLWHRMLEPKKFAATVEFFQQKLRELLKVAGLQQLSEKDKTVTRNELVAAFMNFLIRLWDHRKDQFKGRVDSVRKELCLLVAILGDTLFSVSELEQVQNVLTEFESVANLSGSLVYCFVFTTDKQFESVTVKIDRAFDALLKRIDLLKANISNMVQSVTDSGLSRKTGAVVDSLFIVRSLFYDLEDLLNRDDRMLVDVKDQIKTLHHELMLSLSVLKDMKEHRHSESEELKEHVVRIRDAAYEAEYLIKSFLVIDTPLWYFSIRFPSVVNKIKLLGSGLQEINKNYDIGAVNVMKNFTAQPSLRDKRNSYEVNEIIVGFDDKIEYVLEQYIRGSEQQLQIVSIYGMPGLGKTTLARKIYNHPWVNYTFVKRSWSVVSQTYHLKSLLINILSSISELKKDTMSSMEEHTLAEHLYKCLTGRKYLIIMDDLWSADVWHKILRYFPNNGNGSRVLFTSRNKDVAPPKSVEYALPSLSDDQCWELLKKNVFGNKPCPTQLVGIGKKIAENCSGLPLAVVVISGLLSTMDRGENTWEYVLKNLGSCFFDGVDNSMMQILELSYQHLPEHLKPCFLYFGAFPEDTEIPVRKLMMLWIAEGFVRKDDEKRVESVAGEYLMELIDKSLVMVGKRRSDGGVKACVVHDLLHDLCLRKADEENFLKLMNNNYSIYERHPRLCFHASQGSAQWRPFFGLHLRSFFGLLMDTKPELLTMKLLRVLDLRVVHGDLEVIKFLLHLRYLAINYMPFSIGHLVNLEYLVVKTTRIVDICPVVPKMTKLRYLHLTPLAIFDEKCTRSSVNSLEYLSNVSITKLEDEEMLKCSPNLRKLKCQCRPLLDKHGMLRYPDFCFLEELESLKMTALRGADKPVEINFPLNIKKLMLDGLRLSWEKMSIVGGLPNLEILKLKYNAVVGKTWDTRDDEFRELRYLRLEILDLRNWNVGDSDHFPSLERLVIRDCYYLEEIPCEIGNFAALQSIEVESCMDSLEQSVRRIEQEQKEMGNGELKVVVGHVFMS